LYIEAVFFIRDPLSNPIYPDIRVQSTGIGGKGRAQISSMEPGALPEQLA
jgi:hypothetical protein